MQECQCQLPIKTAVRLLILTCYVRYIGQPLFGYRNKGKLNALHTFATPPMAS